MRLAGAIALLTACLERPVYRCDEWADCGPGGACEPIAGACSFPDTACDSGRRFSELAPGAFRDACVEPVDGAGRGDMCIEGETTCAGYRECIGGRCVAVDRISATSGLFAVTCANNRSSEGFGPVVFWGESTAFAQFSLQAVQLNSCGGPSGCPADCAQCTDCPAYCQGSFAARQLSTGTNHFCVENGETYCYGSNASLQTGYPTPEFAAFTWLGASNDFDLLAAGDKHTCARAFGGTVIGCWGDNTFGQLNKAPSSMPQAAPEYTQPFPVMGSEPIRNINYLSSSTTFTCAATINRVKCWGQPPFPAGFVDELSNVGSIVGLETGEGHACVLVDGKAMCWGANDSGQAAPETPTSSPVVPTVVRPDLTFTNIVAGRAHTCARTESGDVYCWGDHSRDQLGQGVIGPGPVRIGGNLTVVGPIAAGTDVTCAVYADDHVRCWGEILELADSDGNVTRFDDLELCQPADGP